MSISVGEGTNPASPLNQEHIQPVESTTLGGFIEERGSFHSDKDHEIALHYADRIEALFAAGSIDGFTYENAAFALRKLIPLDNENGRSINGKLLAPGTERRIASRLTSEEIDIAGPDGSWGKLPKAVKRWLTFWDPKANIAIEPSSHCTVGCSFCSIATIGPLTKKASFDSIITVVDEFAGMQKTYKYRTPDTLYWGSDPFDLKWAATDTTPERDYTDLLRAYLELPSTRGREVFTSTAVPLGEELRILAFADALTNGSLPRNNDLSLRISRTTANTGRVDHLQRLLELFNPGKELPINIDKPINPAARGRRLEKPQDSIRPWDILGPNCRDGVIIGVTAVESTIMLGASPERPKADPRVPIETINKKRRTYRIPGNHFKPEVTDKKPYADVKWSVITVNEKGRAIHRSVEKTKHDPHRALARLALGIDRIDALVETDQFTPKALAKARRRHRADLRLLQKHTRTTDNWVMERVLDMYTERGLFSTRA